jgi:ABC-2 type transport system permease protein
VGNTVSSAMLLSVLNGMADFAGESYLGNVLPYLSMPTPNVKISTLYNPNLSYEFYLEPFVIPAILHLLLCCCVAFAIGQELKRELYLTGQTKMIISKHFLQKYWSMW